MERSGRGATGATDATVGGGFEGCPGLGATADGRAEPRPGIADGLDGDQMLVLRGAGETDGLTPAGFAGVTDGEANGFAVVVDSVFCACAASDSPPSGIGVRHLGHGTPLRGPQHTDGVVANGELGPAHLQRICMSLITFTARSGRDDGRAASSPSSNG